MDFWSEHRTMTGMRTSDEKEMACRFCIHAEKGHIGWGACIKYPKPIRKPDGVYFDNDPCPKFEKGEDLLPYDVCMEEI